MRYCVYKGHPNKPMLDSTWGDLKRANDRRDTLRKSSKKINVWIQPLEDEPHNYRKPNTAGRPH